MRRVVRWMINCVCHNCMFLAVLFRLTTGQVLSTQEACALRVDGISCVLLGMTAPTREVAESPLLVRI